MAIQSSRLLFVAAAMLMAVICSATTANDDLITSLPGLNETLNFKQYSGYISIPGSAKQLHYWFVESQRNPSKDPFVLWMNGGPGCSSVDGLLTEHGPLHLKDDKTMYVNPYSWNRVANVLYLEAPAGVGFSYSTNPNDYNTDDYKTAHDNNLFVRGFFKRFPQFLTNDFYVSGESYAGIYVPMLADAIDKGNTAGQQPKINLKGYLVGNGVTDANYDGGSFYDFAFYHSLYSQEIYEKLQKACPSYVNNVSDECINLMNEAQNQIGDINPYDVTGPCEGQAAIPRLMGQNFKRQEAMTKGMKNFLPASWQLSSSNGVPCIDSSIETAYLNRDDVKTALHVKKDIYWQICSSILNYNSVVSSVIDIHKRLMLKYRVLIYSGDADSVVNYVGSQRWVNSLNRKVVSADRPWYYENPTFGRQVGGHVKVWDRITFLTIRNAGHMVPDAIIGQPPAAYHFFEAFMNRTPF